MRQPFETWGTTGVTDNQIHAQLGHMVETSSKLAFPVIQEYCRNFSIRNSQGDHQGQESASFLAAVAAATASSTPLLM